MEDFDKTLLPDKRSFAIGSAFTLLLWLLALALWSGDHLSKPEALSGPFRLLLLETYAIGVIFSAILAFAIIHAQRIRSVYCVALTTLAALFFGTLHGFIDALLVQEFARQEGLKFSGISRQFYGGLMPFLLLYLFYAAVIGLMRSTEVSRRRERQLAEAHLVAQEARLAALRFQLNPHFLFNTLNAISSLIVTDRNDAAEKMTMRLSAFLRNSLESDMLGTVTLDEEFATLQAYLDIEAARFGDRLQFHISCPVHLLDAQIPSFLLQPLIENAVKYAVAPSRDTVSIEIVVEARDTDLLLTVRDNGSHALANRSAGGTGLGLANVRQRLLAHYGEQASLEATAQDKGFLARIVLPLTLPQMRNAAE